MPPLRGDAMSQCRHGGAAYVCGALAVGRVAWLDAVMLGFAALSGNLRERRDCWALEGGS